MPAPLPAARPRNPDWLRTGGWPYDEPRPLRSDAERRLECELQRVLYELGSPNPTTVAARLMDGPLAPLLEAAGYRGVTGA